MAHYAKTTDEQTPFKVKTERNTTGFSPLFLLTPYPFRVISTTHYIFKSNVSYAKMHTTQFETIKNTSKGINI